MNRIADGIIHTGNDDLLNMLLSISNQDTKTTKPMNSAGNSSSIIVPSNPSFKNVIPPITKNRSGIHTDNKIKISFNIDLIFPLPFIANILLFSINYKLHHKIILLTE